MLIAAVCRVGGNFFLKSIKNCRVVNSKVRSKKEFTLEKCQNKRKTAASTEIYNPFPDVCKTVHYCQIRTIHAQKKSAKNLLPSDLTFGTIHHVIVINQKVMHFCSLSCINEFSTLIFMKTIQRGLKLEKYIEREKPFFFDEELIYFQLKSVRSTCLTCLSLVQQIINFHRLKLVLLKMVSVVMHAIFEWSKMLSGCQNKSIHRLVFEIFMNIEAIRKPYITDISGNRHSIFN